MKKIAFYYIAGLVLLTSIVVSSCSDSQIVTPRGQGELKLPAQAFNYSLEFDKVKSRLGVVNRENPQVSNNGATLGRVLFYDVNLSKNNAIACASCHHQSKGFADGLSHSKGFEGKVTPRNSMAIINAATNNNLFWDSRSNSAFDLALKPVQNHIEMGMEDMAILTKKIAGISYYPDLFKKAYGNTHVSEEKIAKALAEFLCSIGSTESKFDQGEVNNFENFTAMEKLGRKLFFGPKTNCSKCHSGSNFSAPDFPGGPYGQPEVKGTANIGLDVVYADQGMGDGKFRIPSLRNIALTGPYMHDGRFETLEEVIAHYNSGIENHPALDENLKKGFKPVKMGLTSFEQKALVAFLNTLTDENMVSNPIFADPFID